MPKQDLGEMLVVETLGRIDSKLDRLDERLDEQGKILAGQAISLEEHVKRSNLLEERIELETKALKDELPKSIQEELRHQRNKLLILVLKVVGTVLALGGGGFGIHHAALELIKIWWG